MKKFDFKIKVLVLVFVDESENVSKKKDLISLLFGH